MEVWGPKLPRGWRYPAGRRPVRAALGDVPDLRVRFDSKWTATWRSPEENAQPVVATARLYSAVRTDPLAPYLELFGRRLSDYPGQSRGEFVDDVLPAIRAFLLEELDRPRPAGVFQPRQLIVYWREDHHEVVVGEG